MTSLEVALAVIVGGVVVAGIVMIFSMVEHNAGNTKAMGKMLVFRQMIEEQALAGGGFPALSEARSLWSRLRPKDYLRSPWGGPVGLELDQATGACGVAPAAFFPVTERRTGAMGRAGGIAYMLSSDANGTVDLYDVTRNHTVKVRSFGAYMYDASGTFPHFPTGGIVSTSGGL